jgi:dihydroorotase (multifunctional complex type)
MFDLGIEGGTIVTSSGRAPRNVYIDSGRIAALSTQRQPAARRLDADGLLVLPGMVDAHVHLMDPAETHREDFPAGTAAAACAGVTTIIEHTHTAPVRTLTDLRRKRQYLTNRSFVDYGLAAHAWPSQLDELPALWQAGIAFIKAFTCTTHGIPGFHDVELTHLLSRIAAISGVCLLHCEDETLTAEAELSLRQQQRDDPGIIPEWRSPEAERSAVTAVVNAAGATGARAVIAHVSHVEVVNLVAQARARHPRIRVETCPHYLALRKEEIGSEGALRKFTPPARATSDADLDAMWRALADGTIDYIASDHAPSTKAQKTSASIWDAPFGLPGLDTTLPFLLAGAQHGRVTYERIVAAYAETPARIYGLQGKGVISSGADADLILLDPTATWTVHDDDLRSKAGWSPFTGRVLGGRPVMTFLRGELVAREGSLGPTSSKTGRYLTAVRPST